MNMAGDADPREMFRKAAKRSIKELAGRISKITEEQAQILRERSAGLLESVADALEKRHGSHAILTDMRAVAEAIRFPKEK